MHLSNWGEDYTPLVEPLLRRLRSLVPDVKIQTHLLHLGSLGVIHPHIDNIEASGEWILGVSLGAERVMRMESVADPDDHFEISLPSGSVYVQRYGTVINRLLIFWC